MTPAEARMEIRPIAGEILAVEGRLRRVQETVPRSPGEEAMFEGEKAWHLAAERRTVVECMFEKIVNAGEGGGEYFTHRPTA